MIHMIRKNFRNRFSLFNANDFTNIPLDTSNGYLGSDNITHTDIKRIRDGKMGGKHFE